MPSGPEETAPRLKLRQGTGRYFLLGLFWVLLSVAVIHGTRPSRAGKVDIEILGPRVVSRVVVSNWVSTLPFRTFPFEDRSLLDHVKRSHSWIEALSEKRFPGGRRVLRVRFWTPIALLRPSYGLMAFEVPVRRASPQKASYLNSEGVSLLGEPYEGSGSLPQVIVRSPLTKDVGLRVVRTIRNVEHCHNAGAPAGQWFSLNGPHEIRFYPGGGAPVLILGTNLGCAPFRLFLSYMESRKTLVNGKLPDGIDLRFSGMLILRPDLSAKPESKDPGEARTLSGSY